MNLLTYEQVAEKFECSVRTIKRMRARGELKATRVSQRGVRFREDVVNLYLVNRTETEPGKISLAAPTRRGAAIPFQARVH